MNTDQEQRTRILQYLRGEMPSREANAFEREMMEDPFLADAVEGLQQEESAFQASLNLQSVDSQLKSGGGKRTLFPYFRAAALVVLLVGSGLVLWLRTQSREEKTAAVAQTESLPESTETLAEPAPALESGPIASADPGSVKTVTPQSEIAEKSAPPEMDYPAESPALIQADPVTSNDAGASESFAGAAPSVSPAKTEAMEDLISSPDVGEQLLVWAGEIPEPAQAESLQLMDANSREKKSQSQSKSEGSAAPAARATTEIQPGYTATVRDISRLIRAGKHSEARLAIQRLEKTHPGAAVISVLYAATEVKQGNAAAAKKSLRTLDKTPYAPRAAEFRNKLP